MIYGEDFTIIWILWWYLWRILCSTARYWKVLGAFWVKIRCPLPALYSACFIEGEYIGNCIGRNRTCPLWAGARFIEVPVNTGLTVVIRLWLQASHKISPPVPLIDSKTPLWRWNLSLTLQRIQCLLLINIPNLVEIRALLEFWQCGKIFASCQKMAKSDSAHPTGQLYQV